MMYKRHWVECKTVFCFLFIVTVVVANNQEQVSHDKTEESEKVGDKLELSKRDINPINLQPHVIDTANNAFGDTFSDFVLNDDLDKRVAEAVNKLENGEQFKDDENKPTFTFDDGEPDSFENDKSGFGPNTFVSTLEKRLSMPMGFTSQLGKRAPFGFTSQLGKRAPMGFLSQLGKRDSDEIEDEVAKRAPMGFISQLGKRMPMGFTSQLGKRIPMGFTSQLGKRMPMGFTSQLGKRMPMGFTSQLGKRMPMGFTSQLGKRIPMGFTSQLGKRIPMGFTSQLGKRIPMGFTSQLGKRIPMGFTSQLGKRIPMGFTSQLGKRVPMGFTSQLGKREQLDNSDAFEDDNDDLYSEQNRLSVRRKKRSTNNLPWYLSRRIIPTRLLRGIDRYSFVSRLGKRSHPYALVETDLE